MRLLLQRVWSLSLIHIYHTNDISFTTSKEDDGKLEKILTPVLKELGTDRMKIEENVAKVSIVGAGMITNPGVAAKMFKVLYEHGYNIQMISTSEIKVSCVLDVEGAKDAVVALHTAFGLDAE